VALCCPLPDVDVTWSIGDWLEARRDRLGRGGLPRVLSGQRPACLPGLRPRGAPITTAPSRRSEPQWPGGMIASCC